jgi:predicted DNA-binding transcriptional regulator AlpA
MNTGKLNTFHEALAAASGDIILSKKQVAAMIGVSLSTLDRMVDRQEFDHLQLSPRRVGWPLSTVQAWMPRGRNAQRKTITNESAHRGVGASRILYGACPAPSRVCVEEQPTRVDLSIYADDGKKSQHRCLTDSEYARHDVR